VSNETQNLVIYTTRIDFFLSKPSPLCLAYVYSLSLNDISICTTVNRRRLNGGRETAELLLGVVS